MIELYWLKRMLAQVTDMALDLAAFNPGNRRKSKGPEEVAEEMSDEEIEKGPLGGLYKTMKVPFTTAVMYHVQTMVEHRGIYGRAGSCRPLLSSGTMCAERLCDVLQAIERVPGAHLINKVLEKGQQAAGRKAPKGLSGWAKSQVIGS